MYPFWSIITPEWTLEPGMASTTKHLLFITDALHMYVEPVISVYLHIEFIH